MSAEGEKTWATQMPFIARVRDRLEQRTGRIAFRWRLGIVYVLITVLGVWVFGLFAFDTQFMLEWFPFLLRGVPLTLFICIMSIVLATVLALIGALGRLSNMAIFRGPANFYVSFVRGTPLIAQIFLVYFALPQIGLSPSMPDWALEVFTLHAVTSGILALGVNYGAYMTEIFRAGIQSIGHGQIEAAHALGMSRGDTMRRIVLPQAVRVIIPPTGNEFIAMLKDSALLGIVGAHELFYNASILGQSRAHPIEAFVVAATIYWLLTIVFSFFQARLERRVARGHVREMQHVH